MAVHSDVIPHKLLNDGVVFLTHLILLRIIGSNQRCCFLCREMIVRRSEDREHLTACQRLVKATGLQHTGKVAQVTVTLDSLPQRPFQDTVTSTLVVLIPRVGAGSEGEGGQCQP